MAVGGLRLKSYGMVIHPDGDCTLLCFLRRCSPEKKAKDRGQMKAEDEKRRLNGVDNI